MKKYCAYEAFLQFLFGKKDIRTGKEKSKKIKDTTKARGKHEKSKELIRFRKIRSSSTERNKGKK